MVRSSSFSSPSLWCRGAPRLPLRADMLQRNAVGNTAWRASLRMEHTLVSRAEIGSAPASREMRAIFIIACVGLSFAAGAQAQDAVRACRQVKDDAERLKCYDRLDTSASNAPRGQRESKADAA